MLRLIPHVLILSLVAQSAEAYPIAQEEGLAAKAVELYEGGQDPRAAYVALHRLLEVDPGHIAGRHMAAKLALELASPALALDHVSFALARLGPGDPEGPMLRLAALAHEAMGEPEAAWNSLQRMASADRDAALARWQQQLAAQHFHIQTMDEIAARASADLKDLASTTIPGLWRAALVSPGDVEVELDRRLGVGLAQDELDGAYALRAALWLSRLKRTRNRIDDWSPLRQFVAWQDAARGFPEGHEIAVLAEVLQRPLSNVPTEEQESAQLAPWPTGDDYEEPVPPADLMGELGAIQLELEAAIASAPDLLQRLEAALAAPGPKGTELPAAIAGTLEVLEQYSALDSRRGICVGPVYALRGDDGKAAEAAFDRTTPLMIEFSELRDALRSTVNTSARVSVDALVESQMRHLLAQLGETPTANEVLAATDALVIWSDTSTSMDERAWRDRASALMEVHPPERPLAPSASTLHALHWLAGLHGPEDILEWLDERAAASRVAAGQARTAYGTEDYAAALTRLEVAIAHSPMDEGLLRLRHQWLLNVAGPEVSAQALGEWWRSASPLDELPLAEMELLYRAGSWSDLLSLSEAALKDWPLSSEGFRFHSLAAAALDLPDAEQRVDPYLRRSERGERQLVEQALRRGLGSAGAKREIFRSWLDIAKDCEPSATDDLAFQVAYVLHDRKEKGSFQYTRQGQSIKRSIETRLGAALAEGIPHEEFEALGASLGAPALADFAAGAAATRDGQWSKSIRYWEKCEGHWTLPAALRTFAAREVTRRNKRPHPRVRGRDAIYVGRSESVPRWVSAGRLLVSGRNADLSRCDGGIVRFLGSNPWRPVPVRIPGTSTPVAILEHAVAGTSTGYDPPTCAWIVRDSTLFFPLTVLGPIDARSCALTDAARLSGTGLAFFQDLLMGQKALIETARPTIIEGLAAFHGSGTKINVQEGGRLQVREGVIDLRGASGDSPWISGPTGDVTLSGVAVIESEQGTLGVEGPGVRCVTVAAAPVRRVLVTTARELVDALGVAEPGDRIELAGGKYNLTNSYTVKASVELAAKEGSDVRLELRDSPEGALRVASGVSVTLRNLDVYHSHGGFGSDGRVPPRRIYVEPGATLLAFDTSFVVGSSNQITLFLDQGAVAELVDSSIQARAFAAAGSSLLLENTRVDKAFVDGPGRVAVHRRPSIINSETRIQLRGSRGHVAAQPEDYRGDHAGSPTARHAVASCESRWADAERAFDSAIQDATGREDRVAAAKRLSQAIHAAGRLAEATDADMEQRFFARFRPLVESNDKDAYALAMSTPMRFSSTTRLMDVLNPETRELLSLSAKVGLRNVDRLRDDDFISLAVAYERAYPLHHPDRARSQRYFADGLPIDEVPTRIAADKREEERLAEERRRRLAAAIEAQRAATAAVEQAEADRRARMDAWNARSTYESNYSTSSYIAAPSSYNSTYYSNQAFYSRLNSFSGGGSYTVSASGVTYR